MKSFEIGPNTDPDLTDKEHIVLFPKHFINTSLSKLKLTKERADGVFELASKIGAEDSKITGVYLRASLGEFISMEETLRVDLPNKNPLKLNDIKNTLLHILRELRNYQFHVSNVELNFNESEATIIKENDFTFSLGPVKTKLTIIDNLEIDDLRRIKNINKNYSFTEIEHMINWMNTCQKEYSIQQLVLKGLKFYTYELVRHYSL